MPSEPTIAELASLKDLQRRVEGAPMTNQSYIKTISQ